MVNYVVAPPSDMILFNIKILIVDTFCQSASTSKAEVRRKLYNIFISTTYHIKIVIIILANICDLNIH